MIYDLFFMNIGDFLQIFEPLPSSRDVGYVLKEWGGCGRVLEH